MQSLAIERADRISARPQAARWLIQDLWADQAVGIVGGEPKCFKSFLALDLAVSVASGTPCLRRFQCNRTGPVLFFPAEDALSDARARLDGICAAAAIRIETLPLYLITEPRLALDRHSDRQKLQNTVATLRPILLVLDPLIRLHTGDENQACDIAPILSFLRELQRRFALAIILVHHARKDAHNHIRPGQALRGTSELHGWGDSNLYLRRERLPGRQTGEQLTLSIEHRCAPSINGLRLHLHHDGDALALALSDNIASHHAPPENSTPSTPDRVLAILRQSAKPLALRQLRALCRIRTQTLTKTLVELLADGRIRHTSNGYCLTPPSVSASLPL